MMRLLLFLTLVYCTRDRALSQDTLALPSPGENLRLRMDRAVPPTLSVYAGDEEIFVLDGPGLDYGGTTYPSGELVQIQAGRYRDTLTATVATKNRRIPDNYNTAILTFGDSTRLELRMYDEGLAYRLTNLPTGRLTEEHMELRLDPATQLYYPKEESYYSHNERTYLRGTPADFADSLASLPVLGVLPSGYHVWLSESNLTDFPGLWVRAYDGGLRGTHPALPASISDVNDRTEEIERADYLAEMTQGQRTPWRILGVSENAAGLLANQLVYLLGEPATDDFDWVRPGQVAWDWYNANNLYGVDFESGINNETYEHYIDFASENGISYIILDEGWSPTEHVLESVDEIDIPELVEYGRERGVGLILWVLWKPFYENLDAATRQYGEWGIRGVKVDFMQRDDQEMVRMYHEMAAAAAEHELLLDFHGAYKPAGLDRTYPNVITREGLKGLEWYKFGSPTSGVGPAHNVTIPFIRMVAGPIDYTPGAMRNAQPERHSFNFDRPVSQGTRVHQLAMYVVYESPLQMLADAPSAYEREPEVTDFITSVPTTWERSVPLAGEVGEYVVVARQAEGGDWYLGALNNLTARDVAVTLDFLPEGDYRMEFFEDGANHTRYAEDYYVGTQGVSAGETITLPLGRGGGYVARLVAR